MFQFVSLASGSSGNCYLLSNEHGSIFIDVGIGVRQIKKYCRELDINLADVRYILITHDHADHVKSVGSLASELNIPVFATQNVHNHIDQNFVVHHKIPIELRKYFNVTDELQLLEMNISTIAVPHDSSDNIGYKIQYDDITFVLLTDIGHITPDIEQYVSQAHYLVIEANHEVEKLIHGTYPEHLKRRILSPLGHLSNSDCALTIAHNATPKLRGVFLCHLSYDNNDPELARYTIEDILRQHGIAPGKDFFLEILKRNTHNNITDLI